MATDIVRYRVGGETLWGVLVGEAPSTPHDIVEVRRLATGATTTAELIAALENGASPASEVERVEARTLLSPVTTPSQIICQGLNYRDHAAEAGHHERKENLIFLKASSSLTGPYDDIVRPDGVELLDYEVEIGIVLRRDVSALENVTDENIGDFVAGVTLCNDVSARDVMFGAGFLQWFRGKSFRTFCPTGPVLRLLEKHEVSATLKALSISLDCNGERRQAASSSMFIHPPANTITELSALMDLRIGDLILTGTPGGVIAQGSPAIMGILKDNLLNDAARREQFTTEMKRSARFLQAGDELVLAVQDDHANRKLGKQVSRIR